MIEAVAFDFDDTLIDGKEMHHAAIIEALDKFGYKRKRVKWIRGATTEEILALNFPNMDEEIKKKIAVYKRSIVQKHLPLAKLLPDARDILDYIKSKGILIGLITNNTHGEINHFLRYFKLRKFFKVIVGIDDAKPKPSPEMFKVFMRKADVKPKEMFYVGDSDYDILASKKARVKIILNTKIHKAKMADMADFKVKSLKEIKGII
ncbi:MAG: HAD family hydrolase [Nanoarchaeota archaeon]|nr:HAD family hydrolase [Nanoarchaeota archaeon]